MRRFRVVAASIVAIALVTATAGNSQAADRFHVPWGVGDNIGGILDTALDAPTAPGANRWSCRPSARYPNPVVLLPGTGVQTHEMRWIAPLLANNGYCVFHLRYGIDRETALGRAGPVFETGTGSIEESSERDLIPFVKRVLNATGADRVDFVGHSQGTVLPRSFIQFKGGASLVGKSVNIAPLWKGTSPLGVGPALHHLRRTVPAARRGIDSLSRALPQMIAGSEYLRALNSASTRFPENIEYTNIVTRYDEVVQPYTSGMAPAARNVTNIVLQRVCPHDLSDHFFVVANPVVGQLILNALDPSHAQPVDCAAHPRNSR